MKKGRKMVLFSLAFILLIAAVLLTSVFVFAASSFLSPNACSGNWFKCANAFADGNTGNRGYIAYTYVTAATNKTGIWYHYSFYIPESAVIEKVNVRADFHATDTSGYVNIQVSGDGGKTFGPSHIVGGNAWRDRTYLIDVTNDTLWTASKLNNQNFRVQVTCFKTTGGPTSTGCGLDWIPVEFTYTPFDFSISLNPSADSMPQGRSAQTNATVTLLSGNPQNVRLSVEDCPLYANCYFSQYLGNPTFSSIFTVTSINATPVGLYTITVVANASDGSVIRKTTYNLTITDSIPVAYAFADPTTGFAPLTVNFTGTAVGGDEPLTYIWDFNDGTYSTLQNPSHPYINPGTYNASLRVIDYDGDVSISYVTIIVNQTNQSVDFSISLNPYNGSIPQGRSAQTDVTVTLLSGNPQNARLWVEDCPLYANCYFSQYLGNPTFSAIFTVATIPSMPVGVYPPITIRVNASDNSITRTAAYTLEVTDSYPTASASADPTSGNAPLTVNFTGTAVGGDEPLTYIWDFNDGTYSTLQNPSHPYINPGTYNASLRVIDYDGDTSYSYVLITANPS